MTFVNVCLLLIPAQDNQFYRGMIYLFLSIVHIIQLPAKLLVEWEGSMKHLLRITNLVLVLLHYIHNITYSKTENVQHL